MSVGALGGAVWAHAAEVDKATGEVLPPGQQDKRSLVQTEPGDYEAWLKGDDATARALIKPAQIEVFDQADAMRTDQLLAAQIGR